ncbi:LysR family transcriptional regulator [Gottfriedia acidiceleris]|uniref:LysR family transcriptional regulator n=1 Tax=Gottfriedia acidiceleris TaxID=371036 RepID=A0ABY4JK45_9BACI|nr:LysR family transcriptional regulator [Gottfriedia acidiceleris]UPM53976.1 LysR family transcriptional regulator [Gottfriedia acidiceleris]
MNFEQMEHIVTVANEMSITKAADKLFISTSGLSQSITQLENKLDIKIFNRSKKSITPTFEGKIVISAANTIINAINEMNKEINQNKKEKHLKITTTIGLFYILQEIILKYNLLNKDISFNLVEQDVSDILNSFMKEDYDFAILSASIDTLKKLKNIAYQHIYTAHFCIGVGVKSPLYSYDYVTPNDIKDETILWYNLKDYKVTTKMLNINNPSKKIIRTNRRGLLLELVKESDAILIIPNIAALHFDLVINEEIKIIPIKENDKFFELNFWLIYFKTKGLTKVATEFINDFLEYKDQYIGSKQGKEYKE